jgi:hypothetical protein
MIPVAPAAGTTVTAQAEIPGRVPLASGWPGSVVDQPTFMPGLSAECVRGYWGWEQPEHVPVARLWTRRQC